MLTWQELQEPSKQLVDNTRQPAERDVTDDFDPERYVSCKLGFAQ